MKPQIISIGGEKINLLKQLGQGTYGTVFLTNIHGKERAIKIITNEKKAGIKSLIEIDAMSKLVHPNLIHSEGTLVSINSNVTVGLIMPLADTDLQKLMKLPSFAESQRIKVLWDITNGVHFLHENGYLHLDLKPMNVLLFNNKTGIEAKLTDFGLSLILETDEKYYPSELVTVTHRAPEILAGERLYSKSSDIWSLGIIFLEVLSGGKTLHREFTEKKVIQFNQRYLSNENIDATLGIYISDRRWDNLIKGMLDFDPDERITTDEILSDFLFSNYKIPTGNIIYKLPLQPRKCDLIYYYGFDYLIRLALNFALKTETIFLAGDIYQRSLAYAHKLTDNFSKDWPNVVVLASTSLYMAIKMVEPYYTEIETFVALGSNMFKQDDLLRIEAALTQLFEGIIYSKNLFTETESKPRLELGFETLRNCHIYHLIDINRWKVLSSDHQGYDKYTMFSDFIVNTKYYQLMLNKTQVEYLPKLFDEDLLKLK